MPITVALVTFVFVALIVVAIWFSVGNDSTQKVVRQRMEAVRKAEKRGDIPTDLKLIRDEMYSSMPLLHRMLMRMSWTRPPARLHGSGRVVHEARQVVLDERDCGLGGIRCRGRLPERQLFLRRSRRAGRLL